MKMIFLSAALIVCSLVPISATPQATAPRLPPPPAGMRSISPESEIPRDLTERLPRARDADTRELYFTIPRTASGVYYDLRGLPAGRLTILASTYRLPGFIPSAGALDITVLSPSLILRQAPGGAFETRISDAGATVRFIMRRNTGSDNHAVLLSIVVQTP